jgi:hypothetical protein
VGLRRAIALVVGVAFAMAGCHHAARVPLLGIGPLRAGDPTLYDDALRAVRAAGHAPVRTDPVHGRFSVRALSDPSRETLFVVQCSRDGYVTVAPEGRLVTRQGDLFEVTRAVREEWTDLVLALERTVPEVTGTP